MTCRLISICKFNKDANLGRLLYMAIAYNMFINCATFVIVLAKPIEIEKVLEGEDFDGLT